jgi:hypothetical protein
VLASGRAEAAEKRADDAEDALARFRSDGIATIEAMQRKQALQAQADAEELLKYKAAAVTAPPSGATATGRR